MAKQRADGRYLAALVASLALLGLAAPSACAAQRFVLPVDVQQGLFLDLDRPEIPYAFALQVAPGIEVGQFQANLVGALTYVSPEWDGSVGAGASGLVPLFVRDLGFRFGAQGSYALRAEAVRAALGLGVDVIGLLRVMVWPGFDFAAKRAYFMTSLGIDVMNLALVLAPPKEPEFEPIP